LSSSPLKVLIVRVSSLGDVVHNLPIVADIRRARPEIQIDWLVEANFADLVSLVSGVQCVIPLALRRWRKRPCSAVSWREAGKLRQTLKRHEYHHVIDCQGLLKTALLARLARGTGILSGLANRTEGSGYEWPVRFFYDQSIPIAPHTHVVERSRQLVAAALGFSLTPDDIDFGLDTQRAATALAATGFHPPTPYSVFVHATSRADKQWPESCWIALGQRLAHHGMTLVLPWGNEVERASSQRIADAIGDQAWVPPQLSLPAIIGLIDGAVATVGVDTGLVHLAAALKRPTVTLYNFDTAWRTGGYWSPHSIDLGGRQCALPTDVEQSLARLDLL
jgi:heptosyltransferase I